MRDDSRSSGGPDPATELESILLRLIPAAGEERERELAQLCLEHPHWVATIRAHLERQDAVMQGIAAHRDAATGTGPDDATNGGAVDDELPGHIAEYRVLQRLGDGGMGRVYLALRPKPMEQKVAIKVIRPEKNSKRLLALFAAERQALALMNHPNIARAFDSGETERGEPYFVMEYVPGLPISEHCDRQRLTLRERIELFVPVCRAVEHAHLKAVIHRDLKPSNVLVAFVDAQATPKIIDFGIAKAAGYTLAGRTLFTEAGRIVGTFQYMSPEQADATPQDIDRRSDVYSLGVMLYELLVGVRPFEFGGLEPIRMLQVIRMLQEQDPEPPSVRIAGLATRSAEIAAARRTEPATLARRIRGDLDWIVMTALERTRTRRYQSAAALADDLERYLHGEPVSVGPPSVAYRLRKRIARNPVAAAATVALLIALVAGTTTSVSFYADARAADGGRLAEAREKEWQTRLKDALYFAYQLDQLVQEAGTLWPARPATLPRLEAWLPRARERCAKLEAVRGALDRYREHAVRDGLAALREHTWSFVHPYAQMEHDRLADLASRLRDFADPGRGLVAEVERRAQFARDLDATTVDQHRERWQQARREIADDKVCPLYHGLVLHEQVGLIPIRRNPEGLWEFSHYQGGKVPEASSDGRLRITERTDVVLVLIPGGSFSMGTEEALDPLAHDNEIRRGEPVHLDPFFLAKYELTQAQWRRFTGKEPSMYRPESLFQGSNGDVVRAVRDRTHPVEHVSWIEVDRVLRERGLLLPTEAQWEYAAKAGRDFIWTTGNDPRDLSGKVNVADQSTLQVVDVLWRKHYVEHCKVYEFELDDGFIAHAPVGTFPPNPFGLHEICGNVGEWCADWLNNYTQKVAPGTGEREAEEQYFRVSRGLGFSYGLRQARLTFRRYDPPAVESGSIGVRPARLLDQP